MSRFKTSISWKQKEEWTESLMAVAEDNEKHERSSLYFLTCGALCSYSIIQMGKQIIKEGQYPRDLNCFCGCNLLFAVVNKVKTNPKWMKKLGKEKEVNHLYALMLKALNLFDKFDKNIDNVLPNIQVQTYILSEYENLIEHILEKENLREIFNNTERHHHEDIVRFQMDLGKYTKDVVDFFLEHFIYKNN